MAKVNVEVAISNLQGLGKSLSDVLKQATKLATVEGVTLGVDAAASQNGEGVKQNGATQQPRSRNAIAKSISENTLNKSSYLFINTLVQSAIDQYQQLMGDLKSITDIDIGGMVRGMGLMATKISGQLSKAFRQASNGKIDYTAFNNKALANLSRLNAINGSLRTALMDYNDISQGADSAAAKKVIGDNTTMNGIRAQMRARMSTSGFKGGGMTDRQYAQQLVAQKGAAARALQSVYGIKDLKTLTDILLMAMSTDSKYSALRHSFTQTSKKYTDRYIGTRLGLKDNYELMMPQAYRLSVVRRGFDKRLQTVLAQALARARRQALRTPMATRSIGALAQKTYQTHRLMVLKGNVQLLNAALSMGLMKYSRSVDPSTGRLTVRRHWLNPEKVTEQHFNAYRNALVSNPEIGTGWVIAKNSSPMYYGDINSAKKNATNQTYQSKASGAYLRGIMADQDLTADPSMWHYYEMKKSGKFVPVQQNGKVVRGQMTISGMSDEDYGIVDSTLRQLFAPTKMLTQVQVPVMKISENGRVLEMQDLNGNMSSSPNYSWHKTGLLKRKGDLAQMHGRSALTDALLSLNPNRKWQNNTHGYGFAADGTTGLIVAKTKDSSTQQLLLPYLVMADMKLGVVLDDLFGRMKDTTKTKRYKTLADVSTRRIKPTLGGKKYVQVGGSYLTGTGLFISEEDLNAINQIDDSSNRHRMLSYYNLLSKDGTMFNGLGLVVSFKLLSRFYDARRKIDSDSVPVALLGGKGTINTALMNWKAIYDAYGLTGTAFDGGAYYMPNRGIFGSKDTTVQLRQASAKMSSTPLDFYKMLLDNFLALGGFYTQGQDGSKVRHLYLPGMNALEEWSVDQNGLKQKHVTNYFKRYTLLMNKGTSATPELIALMLQIRKLKLFDMYDEGRQRFLQLADGDTVVKASHKYRTDTSLHFSGLFGSDALLLARKAGRTFTKLYTDQNGKKAMQLFVRVTGNQSNALFMQDSTGFGSPRIMKNSLEDHGVKDWISSALLSAMGILPLKMIFDSLRNVKLARLRASSDPEFIARHVLGGRPDLAKRIVEDPLAMDDQLVKDAIVAYQNDLTQNASKGLFYLPGQRQSRASIANPIDALLNPLAKSFGRQDQVRQLYREAGLDQYSEFTADGIYDKIGVYFGGANYKKAIARGADVVNVNRSPYAPGASITGKNILAGRNLIYDKLQMDLSGIVISPNAANVLNDSDFDFDTLLTNILGRLYADLVNLYQVAVRRIQSNASQARARREGSVTEELKINFGKDYSFVDQLYRRAQASKGMGLTYGLTMAHRVNAQVNADQAKGILAYGTMMYSKFADMIKQGTNPLVLKDMLMAAANGRTALRGISGLLSAYERGQLTGDFEDLKNFDLTGYVLPMLQDQIGAYELIASRQAYFSNPEQSQVLSNAILKYKLLKSLSGYTALALFQRQYADLFKTTFTGRTITPSLATLIDLLRAAQDANRLWSMRRATTELLAQLYRRMGNRRVNRANQFIQHGFSSSAVRNIQASGNPDDYAGYRLLGNYKNILKLSDFMIGVQSQELAMKVLLAVRQQLAIVRMSQLQLQAATPLQNRVRNFADRASAALYYSPTNVTTALNFNKNKYNLGTIQKGTYDKKSGKKIWQQVSPLRTLLDSAYKAGSLLNLYRRQALITALTGQKFYNDDSIVGSAMHEALLYAGGMAFGKDKNTSDEVVSDSMQMVADYLTLSRSNILGHGKSQLTNLDYSERLKMLQSEGVRLIYNKKQKDGRTYVDVSAKQKDGSPLASLLYVGKIQKKLDKIFGVNRSVDESGNEQIQINPYSGNADHGISSWMNLFSGNNFIMRLGKMYDALGNQILGQLGLDFKYGIYMEDPSSPFMRQTLKQGVFTKAGFRFTPDAVTKLMIDGKLKFVINDWKSSGYSALKGQLQARIYAHYLLQKALQYYKNGDDSLLAQAYKQLINYDLSTGKYTSNIGKIRTHDVINNETFLGLYGLNHLLGDSAASIFLAAQGNEYLMAKLGYIRDLPLYIKPVWGKAQRRKTGRLHQPLTAPGQTLTLNPLIYTTDQLAKGRFASASLQDEYTGVYGALRVVPDNVLQIAAIEDDGDIFGRDSSGLKPRSSKRYGLYDGFNLMNDIRDLRDKLSGLEKYFERIGDRLIGSVNRMVGIDSYQSKIDQLNRIVENGVSGDTDLLNQVYGSNVSALQFLHGGAAASAISGTVSSNPQQNLSDINISGQIVINATGGVQINSNENQNENKSTQLQPKGVMPPVNKPLEQTVVANASHNITGGSEAYAGGQTILDAAFRNEIKARKIAQTALAERPKYVLDEINKALLLGIRPLYADRKGSVIQKAILSQQQMLNLRALNNGLKIGYVDKESLQWKVNPLDWMKKDGSTLPTLEDRRNAAITANRKYLHLINNNRINQLQEGRNNLTMFALRGLLRSNQNNDWMGAAAVPKGFLNIPITLLARNIAVSKMQQKAAQYREQSAAKKKLAEEAGSLLSKYAFEALRDRVSYLRRDRQVQAMRLMKTKYETANGYIKLASYGNLGTVSSEEALNYIRENDLNMLYDYLGLFNKAQLRRREIYSSMRDNQKQSRIQARAKLRAQQRAALLLAQALLAGKQAQILSQDPDAYRRMYNQLNAILSARSQYATLAANQKTRIDLLYKLKSGYDDQSDPDKMIRTQIDVNTKDARRRLAMNEDMSRIMGTDLFSESFRKLMLLAYRNNGLISNKYMLASARYMALQLVGRLQSARSSAVQSMRRNGYQLTEGTAVELMDRYNRLNARKYLDLLDTASLNSALALLRSLLTKRAKLVRTGVTPGDLINQQIEEKRREINGIYNKTIGQTSQDFDKIRGQASASDNFDYAQYGNQLLMARYAQQIAGRQDQYVRDVLSSNEMQASRFRYGNVLNTFRQNQMNSYMRKRAAADLIMKVYTSGMAKDLNGVIIDKKQRLNAEKFQRQNKLTDLDLMRQSEELMQLQYDYLYGTQLNGYSGTARYDSLLRLNNSKYVSGRGLASRYINAENKKREDVLKYRKSAAKAGADKQQVQKNLDSLYDEQGNLIDKNSAAQALLYRKQLVDLNQLQLNYTNKANLLLGTNKGLLAVFGSIGKSVQGFARMFGRQYFYKILGLVKQFVTSFSDQMATIQSISGKTNLQMAEVQSNTLTKAKTLRTSVSEVANVQAALYRQGLSDALVNRRTDQIIKFAKVSGISTTDATKAVTTAMKNNLWSDSQSAIDSMAALGDNSAITAADIQKAIQKSAAAANAAGLSGNLLTSLVAIAGLNTQLGGAATGTFMQTLLSRMNKVTTLDYVKDQNGLIVSINDVDKALKTAGISIRDQNGNYKDTISILRLLGTVWEDLSDTQQSAISYAMSGTKQSNNLKALIQGIAQDNGLTLDKYLGLTLGSLGTVDSKYQTMVETVSGHLATLKSSFLLFLGSLHLDAVTGFFDAISSGLLGLTMLLQSANNSAIGVITLVAAVTALLAAIVAVKAVVTLGATLGGDIAKIAGITAAVATGVAVTGLAIGGAEKAVMAKLNRTQLKIQAGLNALHNINLVNSVKNSIQVLKDFKKLYVDAQNAANLVDVQKAITAWESLTTYFPLLRSSVGDLASDFSNLGDAILGALQKSILFSKSKALQTITLMLNNGQSSGSQFYTTDLGKEFTGYNVQLVKAGFDKLRQVQVGDNPSVKIGGKLYYFDKLKENLLAYFEDVSTKATLKLRADEAETIVESWENGTRLLTDDLIVDIMQYAYGDSTDAHLTQKQQAIYSYISTKSGENTSNKTDTDDIDGDGPIPSINKNNYVFYYDDEKGKYVVGYTGSGNTYEDSFTYDEIIDMYNSNRLKNGGYLSARNAANTGLYDNKNRRIGTMMSLTADMVAMATGVTTGENATLSNVLAIKNSVGSYMLLGLTDKDGNKYGFGNIFSMIGADQLWNDFFLSSTKSDLIDMLYNPYKDKGVFYDKNGNLFDSDTINKNIKTYMSSRARMVMQQGLLTYRLNNDETYGYTLQYKDGEVPEGAVKYRTSNFNDLTEEEKNTIAAMYKEGLSYTGADDDRKAEIENYWKLNLTNVNGVKIYKTLDDFSSNISYSLDDIVARTKKSQYSNLLGYLNTAGMTYETLKTEYGYSKNGVNMPAGDTTLQLMFASLESGDGQYTIEQVRQYVQQKVFGLSISDLSKTASKENYSLSQNNAIAEKINNRLPIDRQQQKQIIDLLGITDEQYYSNESVYNSMYSSRIASQVTEGLKSAALAMSEGLLYSIYQRDGSGNILGIKDAYKDLTFLLIVQKIIEDQGMDANAIQEFMSYLNSYTENGYEFSMSDKGKIVAKFNGTSLLINPLKKYDTQRTTSLKAGLAIRALRAGSADAARSVGLTDDLLKAISLYNSDLATFLNLDEAQQASQYGQNLKKSILINFQVLGLSLLLAAGSILSGTSDSIKQILSLGDYLSGKQSRSFASSTVGAYLKAMGAYERITSGAANSDDWQTYADYFGITNIAQYKTGKKSITEFGNANNDAAKRVVYNTRRTAARSYLGLNVLEDGLSIDDLTDDQIIRRSMKKNYFMKGLKGINEDSFITSNGIKIKMDKSGTYSFDYVDTGADYLLSADRYTTALEYLNAVKNSYKSDNTQSTVTTNKQKMDLYNYVMRSGSSFSTLNGINTAGYTDALNSLMQSEDYVNAVADGDEARVNLAVMKWLTGSTGTLYSGTDKTNRLSTNLQYYQAGNETLTTAVMSDYLNMTLRLKTYFSSQFSNWDDIYNRIKSQQALTEDQIELIKNVSGLTNIKTLLSNGDVLTGSYDTMFKLVTGTDSLKRTALTSYASNLSTNSNKIRWLDRAISGDDTVWSTASLTMGFSAKDIEYYKGNRARLSTLKGLIQKDQTKIVDSMLKIGESITGITDFDLSKLSQYAIENPNFQWLYDLMDQILKYSNVNSRGNNNGSTTLAEAYNSAEQYKLNTELKKIARGVASDLKNGKNLNQAMLNNGVASILQLDQILSAAGVDKSAFYASAGITKTLKQTPIYGLTRDLGLPVLYETTTDYLLDPESANVNKMMYLLYKGGAMSKEQYLNLTAMPAYEKFTSMLLRDPVSNTYVKGLNWDLQTLSLDWMALSLGSITGYSLALLQLNYNQGITISQFEAMGQNALSAANGFKQYASAAERSIDVLTNLSKKQQNAKDAQLELNKYETKGAAGLTKKQRQEISGALGFDDTDKKFKLNAKRVKQYLDLKKQLADSENLKAGQDYMDAFAAKSGLGEKLNQQLQDIIGQLIAGGGGAVIDAAWLNDAFANATVNGQIDSGAFKEALLKAGVKLESASAIASTLDGFTGLAGEQKVTYTLTCTSLGDQVILTVTSSGSSDSANSQGGGGGGGGKSAAKKLLLKQSHLNDKNKHVINMLQALMDRLDSAGLYTKLISQISNLNNAYLRDTKTRKTHIKLLKSQLNQTKKGTDDWYSLRDAIYSLELAIASNTKSIQLNVKKQKELQSTIRQTITSVLKSIDLLRKTRKETLSSMLDARVSMELTILEAIKQRYNDDWLLMQKDILKKKLALEELKLLINLRLQARKNAQDEALKYELLALYKRQLALIETDSTRTKDAALLRLKISKLLKLLYWSQAEELAKAQQEALEKEAESLDDYETYSQEYLDNLLLNANNFASLLNLLMAKSLSLLYEWLKANDQDYLNSFKDKQQQMYEGWEETWKQMYNIADTDWLFVKSIMTDKNTFLKYMKQSDTYKNASETLRKLYEYEWGKAYDDMISAQKKGSTPNHTDSNSTSTTKSTSNSSSSSSSSSSSDSSLSSTSTTKSTTYSDVSYAASAVASALSSSTLSSLYADVNVIRKKIENSSILSIDFFSSNIDSSMFGNTTNTIESVNVTINEASIANDVDMQSLAEIIGQLFVKELDKTGFHTSDI